MAEGLTTELLWIATCTWVVGFLLIRRFLSNFPAALLAGVKVLIPLAYFAWFIDGTWLLLDDQSYFSQGSTMLGLGYSPLSALIDPSGLNQLYVVAGSTHIAYGWWNVLAQFLFGEHYFSAIFLNVMVVCFSSLLMVKMIRQMNFPDQYAKMFGVFFLLQWDITVWSSFVNLKDTLVMSLTVVALYSALKLYSQFKLRYLASLGFALFIFLGLRFYIPMFIIISVLGWIMTNNRSRRNLLLIPIFLILLYLVFPLRDVDTEALKPAGLLQGLAKFLLTPQPWAIDESYSFLLLPSIFHWVMFIPAALAAFSLWRRNQSARLLIFYFLIVVGFYAIFPGEAGPRHRVQITFVLAWLQFHFLWLLNMRLQGSRQDNIQYPAAHPTQISGGTT